jgi:3-hydroxy-9,10-secoandrosta-1,3,5(10)-triene-9,17-dione monooxygenase reductase component
MPPDVAAFRSVMSHFATGVTVVTTWGENGPTGLTASAICSLSLDPLLMIVCLDNGSRTLAAVRRTRRLVVNVLAADQRALAATFASKASESEKFRGVAWHEVAGLPVLDGVVAWLGGEVRDLLPGGDHVIGVTAVEATGAAGGDPLIHHRGLYRSLASD